MTADIQILRQVLKDMGLEDEISPEQFLFGSPEIERGCCKICDLYLERAIQPQSGDSSGSHG